jgi:DNA-directed RNA polymerase specialized sigma24 family protein
LPINTQINLLTDVELLEQLCSSKDDDLLYKEFLRRFLPEVKSRCELTCKQRKLDKHLGLQIAHDTFERFRKYKSFNIEKVKLHDKSKAIIVYLCKISTSLFNNFHRDEKHEESNYKTYFDDILESVDPTASSIESLKNKKDLAVFIFCKLNSKEKRIILTDLEYKRHHKYLPDTVIEELARELSLKPASIRKARERAIEKIKKAIDEINQ